MLTPSKMPLPSPIQPREKLDILDSTKLNDFQTCPRQFFYDHVLGWKSRIESVHLLFGQAFHEAMEVLLANHGNMTPQVAQQAMFRFKESFEESTRNHDPGDFPRNKTPKTAAELIGHWVGYFNEFPMEVLYTEIIGNVPIDDDGQLIHFKIDAVVKHAELNILCLEHKTAFADSKAWRAQWQTAIQPKVYTHALYCNYPREQVFGAIVNGFLCTSSPSVIQVLVNQTPAMMAEFIWHIRYLVKYLQHNFEALCEAKESDPILMAFPKNTTACTKWNRPCPYIDFCTAWSNPLQHAHEPPIGMVQRDWDPREKYEATANYRLTKDGFEEIGTHVKTH